MSKFRLVKNGYVSDGITDGDLSHLCDYFRTYLKLSNDFSYLTDPSVVKEVLSNIELVVGNSFKDWLIANYKNGIGVRAQLVTRCLLVLSGEATASFLIQKINSDFNIDYQQTDCSVKTGPSVGYVCGNATIEKLLAKLEDFDLYRVLELIGPVQFVKMLLTFNGGANAK